MEDSIASDEARNNLKAFECAATNIMTGNGNLERSVAARNI